MRKGEMPRVVNRGRDGPPCIDRYQRSAKEFARVVTYRTEVVL